MHLRAGGWPRLILVVVAILGCQSLTHAGGDVREPAVAGQFYPDDAAKLQAALTAFFADAIKPRVSDVQALVVPHAGIVYSGQVAADGYAQILAAASPPDLVVILGTNHTVPGLSKAAISPARAFRTPLGDAPIDLDVVAALLHECTDCTLDARAHAREHSVEVQVPFVQHAFPKARIVPIVVGSDDLGATRRLGECLARTISGRRALIVASSDLSHYPPAADAERVDRETLEAIAGLDPRKVKHVLGKGLDPGHALSTRACGEAPVLTALWAARSLGASRGVILSYANSGRMVVGDPRRVVGYGAVALASGAVAPGPSAFEPTQDTDEARTLSEAEGQQLVALARSTLDRALSAEIVPVLRGFDARLWVRQGAFVTLRSRKDEGLRGCIGTIPDELPLAQTVGRMAISAALSDSRFAPVRHEELRDLSVEVSALTPPMAIADVQAIVVGRHGVILKKGDHTAVFLPQVASEQGWGRDQMLGQLCRKAGLETECWREGARFSVFEAQVFHERPR